MNLNYLMVFVQCQIFKTSLSISYKSIKLYPPIHLYINKIDKRLVFKIKDGCKLELQILENMNSLGTTKK